MQTTVSIIIKALNEEKHIERCLASALRALQAFPEPGEVILADSLSKDRTVEIAARLPVRIVQLTDAGDRCCGVGAQLGYQVARGEFVYILDGDMELDEGFLPQAVAALRVDAKLGGVAGLVTEMVVDSLEFKDRASRSSLATAAQRVPTLNMGGLYRRSAIEPTGYLTNRNLHACEEFELGARLNAAGWQLARLGVPAVRHYGHSDDSFKLLLRRWRSGYASGPGELLRSAVGTPYFWFTLTRLRVYAIQLPLALGWIVALGAFAIWPQGWATWLVATLLALLALIGTMAARKGSFSAGLYAVASWHVGLAGLVRGLLLGRPRDPRGHINSRVLQ
jgi:glycosyltransferase involved in cell wall biosynthesis